MLADFWSTERVIIPVIRARRHPRPIDQLIVVSLLRIADDPLRDLRTHRGVDRLPKLRHPRGQQAENGHESEGNDADRENDFDERESLRLRPR